MSTGQMARLLTALVVAGAPALPAQRVRLSGEAAFETRAFPEAPLYPGQDGARVSPSLALTPDFKYESAGRSWRFSAIGFVRLDRDDSRRSHVDVRKLGALYLGDRWSAFAGVGKVFWGVTEVDHLVDIVNQTDGVEDIDGEDKLGQPMATVTVERSWGSLDLFYLPYFRPRTFPSAQARLRGPMPVASVATFEAPAGRWHQDLAVRWSRAFGAFDVGASVFRGTSREPRLPIDTESGDQLVPRYDLIDQVGVDAQWTRHATLWKLEAITRGGQGRRFVAATLGMEHTLYTVLGGASDVGLLAEVMIDGRDPDAPPTIFDHDLFAGVRWAANDVHDTSLLAGSVVDYQTGEMLAIVEAERRTGGTWQVGLEARIFANTVPGRPASTLRRDGFVKIRLSRFF